MRMILISLVCLSSLFSHKLNIFLNQEENRVYVSSYYASGSFCKDCKVEVSNKQKELIQAGNTNNKGEFIITHLDSLIYVEVEALGGHKVQNSLEVELNKKEEIPNKELKTLIEENKKLKREIELLKEKNSFSDIFKMIFALLVMAGIFLALKKIKRVEK